MMPLTKRPAWKALKTHQEKIKSLHLRKLFDADRKRSQRMTVEAAGPFLDYSKNRIVDQTITLLLRLANQSCLRERINAMFSGDKINITENRAVLHVALRAPPGASIIIDGKNVVPQVQLLSAMRFQFGDHQEKPAK
jgi:glucose-6-phosphate isomerase